MDNELLFFNCDYNRGAHPRVLEALCRTNLEPLDGYGEDCYCRRAEKKILEACACPEGKVFFISGGTQTNQIVIDTLLQSYQGVVAADSGHVNVHEAGAIEFTGHKVLTLPGTNGKVNAADLEAFVSTFYGDGNYEHMVFPGMLYISQPTEYGTLYSKAELEALYSVCRSHDMPLFIDGARLVYALCGGKSDVKLEDYPKLCDCFYIGGTKAGLLCGEAVIFTHNNAPAHFNTLIKQHGAMMAKGRLIGVQFDALFTDRLYEQISRETAEKTEKLTAMLKEKNYRFFLDSPTNQQFIIVENEKLPQLAEKVKYGFIFKYDDTHTVIRLCVAWSTTDEEIEKLGEIL